jgi:ribonuclease G
MELIMKTLVMDIMQDRTQTALIHEGKLVEVVTNNQTDIVGNIYVATVERAQKNFAFLHLPNGAKAFLQRKNHIDTATLKVGQKLTIQIKKEATQEKDAFASEDINFVGKNLILLKSPTKTGVFVSDKIQETKSEQLRTLAESICPNGFCLVIRTIAQFASTEEINEELAILHTKASNILQQADAQSTAPTLIYNENQEHHYTSSLRALLSTNVDNIVINNQEHLCYISKMAQTFGVTTTYKQGDLFAEYEVIYQLKELTKNKVWLKSGGYIIIEKTTALTVIDVNTGKNTNKNKDILTQTNIEAATEIARQIRLRNITGIIVIDFINIKYSPPLLNHLKEQVKKDRTTTVVVGITNLGLVEMTRARSN